MKTAVSLLAGAIMLVGGACGGSDASTSAGGSGETTPPATTSQAAGTASDVPALVGRWRRVNSCPELVAALSDAGLGTIAPSVVGDYFPDTPAQELARKTEICAGAKPFVHDHFFAADGSFGSLTAEEEQVDDGTYELLDGNRLRIGNGDTGAVFRYRIRGDVLSLSPVITAAMREQALAHPSEFSPAGWSVAVSYPGQTWKRVDCGRWC